MSETRETPQTILQRKGREPIAALTAYDFPMAKLLDDAGVPLLLVGDSLGMVVLGYPDTTLVTLDEMAHHVRAVARAKPSGLIAADLPFKTYETPSQAVESAKRLIDAGAEAVKAEGAQVILPQLEAIHAVGIPFLGHLGMLPQHVLEEGGYRIKGRDEEERGRCSPTPGRLAKRARSVSCSSSSRQASRRKSRLQSIFLPSASARAATATGKF